MFDRTEYNKQYRKNNLKRVPLDVSTEYYEQIKEHVEQTNETINGFIKRAINETIKNDNARINNN